MTPYSNLYANLHCVFKKKKKNFISVLTLLRKDHWNLFANKDVKAPKVKLEGSELSQDFRSTSSYSHLRFM